MSAVDRHRLLKSSALGVGAVAVGPLVLDGSAAKAQPSERVLVGRLGVGGRVSTQRRS